jgi:predicted transcriptional regulator
MFGVLEAFAGVFMAGIWMAFIGMFLTNLARQAYESVVTRELLAGVPVSRFMTRDPVTVRPDLDLLHLAEDYVYRHHRKAFPVSSNGHVEGLVSTEGLQRVPRESWGQHSVAEIMDRDIDRITVAPDTEALSALKRMQESGSTRLLVVDNNQLAGVVTARDLLDYLDLKLAIGER